MTRTYKKKPEPKKVTLQQTGGPLVKFNADALRIVQNFTSNEDTRYYLGGVAFQEHDAGGAVAVATDGHTLAAYYDPDAQVSNLPPSGLVLKMPMAIKSALKATPGGFFIHHDEISHVVTNQHDIPNPRVITEHHIATRHNKPIDCTFPDWRRTVPKTIEPGASFAVNLHLLKRFKDALSLRRTVYVQIFTSTQGSPLVIRSSEHPHFLGMCMPMRDMESSALPAWFQP